MRSYGEAAERVAAYLLFMKFLPLVFLLCGAVLVPGGVGAAVERAAAPQLGDADFAQPSPSERHVAKVAAVKSGEYDLALIGDSITHTVGELGGKYEALRAVWERHYAPRRAINLGHNGYRTENVLWNLQQGELDFVKSPKVAMILIGTNNADDRHFAKVHRPEEIVAGTRAIVELIKQRHPSTKILLLRIFPRGGDGEAGTGEGIFHTSPEALETCRKAGEMTAQLADGKQVFWLDINRVFLRPDGSINTDLMPDLLHPNLAGAEAWAQAVAPTLDHLMAMPPRATMAVEKRGLWEGPAPLGEGKSEAGNAQVTVYRPERPNGAAAVICPGGGYGMIVTGREAAGMGEWLNRHGITGIVLEYRLPAGRAMVPLWDAQRALRWVRAEAGKWGVDRDRVGMIGFSAGGHLAASAATHFDGGVAGAADVVERESCRPNFAMLVYPVISMGEWTHGGSKENLLGPHPAAELVEYFSNEKRVSAQTPPCFLTHARDDKTVSFENSQLFHRALLAKQVATEYVEFPTGDHGFVGNPGPLWEAWQDAALQWLRKLQVIPQGD